MADRPITSISLRDVRELIDEKDIGGSVAEAVDTLLGLVITLSPVAVGAVAGPAAGLAAIPLWQLIEPKNELIAVFKTAIRKLSRSAPGDYLDRAERMAAANCLLVYVAYFDAFRELWPRFASRLGLDEKEAKAVLTVASGYLPGTSDSLAEYGIAVPHPAGPLTRQGRDRLYESMTVYLLNGIERSARVSPIGSKAVNGELLESLLSRAEKLYWAEYLGMAVEFQQFFVWSALRAQVAGAEGLQGLTEGQAAMGASITELAGDQRTWFELMGRDIYSLDLGLRELRAVIAALPAPGGVAPDTDVQLAAERLHEIYAAILRRRVVDEQFSVAQEGPGLTFPEKIRGFVPQAYRVVTCDGDEAHLERDEQWHDVEVRPDIGAFVMRYLESPYSVQAPLLVLGHPGSGKSLLTEVLAGHLAYPSYTTIRVRLRDIDPDKTFLTLLEEQIQADTGGVHVTWAHFAASLRMTPPVIILDGYDELLQATGKVFAAYLDSVREFQEQQALHKCPVRVIVTSRVTLIDRARVPEGTTVVRLEEFDAERRDAWADIWNEHNAAYFRLRQAQPFVVPDNEKVVELARQPLLLMMLAIYDSAANELSSQPDIDQTLLYDRLLRRFIERELSKGKRGREFTASLRGAQAEAIDREMERLGIAAIGMFNRQDVKISRDDLNKDLSYFDAEREAAEGRALAQADLLLGSFFFVHESRSNLRDEPATPAAPGPAAFEFLHNTFGEFLAADYILRQATEEARTVRELSGSRRMDAKRAEHLSQLTEHWYGCLIHTPLFTRPVILTMIQEWSRHRMGDKRSRADLLAELDEIVSAQLRIILDDISIPDPDPARRRESPYARLSRRGHAATYSLNLVLLRAWIGDDGFLLDEAALGGDPTGCRPWDSLVSLWRSWFPLESLGALALTLTATRQGDRIEVKPQPAGLGNSGVIEMMTYYAAAVALADNMTAASAGLHVAALANMPQEIFSELWDRVGPAVADLAPAAELLWLKKYAPNGRRNPAHSEDLTSLGTGSLHPTERADVVARMTNSPNQWTDIADIRRPEELRDLSLLSSYEVETAIHAWMKLDPTWLPNLLCVGLDAHDGGIRFKVRANWPSFLRTPAAAPVLRAAVREFDRNQCADGIEWIERDLDGHAPAMHDVDAAAALAVFAYQGGAVVLCANSLGVILDRCEQGEWKLLDIPVQTWERLADAFRSPSPAIAERKPRFIDLLEDAVAESFDGLGEDSSWGANGMAPFWVQALRIGATHQVDRILSGMGSSLTAEALPAVSGAELRYILALIGWAREQDDPALAHHLFSTRFPFGTWLEQFLGASAEWNPAAVDESTMGRGLTFKEAMDLRWLLGVLPESNQHRTWRTAPRRARRRRRPSS